jgi:hypothetical protein
VCLVDAREGLPEVESVRFVVVRCSVWPDWGRIPRSHWHLFLNLFWRLFLEVVSVPPAAVRLPELGRLGADSKKSLAPVLLLHVNCQRWKGLP